MSLDSSAQFDNSSEYWKIFRRSGDDLFSFTESNMEILQSDIFLDEKDYRKGDDKEKKKKAVQAEGFKYQKGWHCFTGEQDAREYLEYVFPGSDLFTDRWYICKVEVREILVKGLIRNLKCVVVRNIKFQHEVEHIVESRRTCGWEPFYLNPICPFCKIAHGEPYNG